MYIVRHVDRVCSDLSPPVIAASVIDRRWDDNTADVKKQNLWAPSAIFKIWFYNVIMV